MKAAKLNVSLLFASLITLFLLVLSSKAAPIQSPVRVRMNANLLRSLMLKKDQEMLDLFADMKIGSFALKDDLILNNVILSFVPISVPVEEYDHHISFDEETFIGFEEKDMKFVGRGSISHAINGEEE